MAQPVVVPRHPQTCPGCLGSGTCWVCLGKRQLRDGVQARPCHRCGGTGLCGEQPELIVIPEQAVRA